MFSGLIGETQQGPLLLATTYCRNNISSTKTSAQKVSDVDQQDLFCSGTQPSASHLVAHCRNESSSYVLGNVTVSDQVVIKLHAGQLTHNAVGMQL